MDIQKIQQYNTRSLIQDLRQIIEQARGQVAATANYTQTMMYWHIGERINREVLGNQRAEYGKQIVSQVATQLQEEYGKKGFESRNIRRMMQFAKEFPDFQIVSPLVSKLSWTHFRKKLDGSLIRFKHCPLSQIQTLSQAESLCFSLKFLTSFSSTFSVLSIE